MTLAYRSIFIVVGDQRMTEEIVIEQFNEWLKKDPIRNPRNLDRDLYKLNSVTVFNPETELIFFEFKNQDGSRVLRARLIENKPDQGRWISTLTLFFPSKSPTETIVMYEGDAPMETDRFGNRRPIWPGRPGLVRRILEVVDARDVVEPNVKLLMRPQVLTETEEVESLFDALCDPERRISILVVASKSSELPNSKIELIDNLMHDAMGTASAFILSHSASRYFSNLIGSDHAVWYDNARLYVPDFDVAVSLNARNHPIIKRNQLDSQNIDKTKKFIGFISRRELTDKPMRYLKRELARIEPSLVEREYQILISGEKIFSRNKVVIRETEKVAQLPNNVLRNIDIFDRLRNSIGVDDVTDQVFDDIVNKFFGYDLLADRLLASSNQMRESDFMLDLLKEERDDAFLMQAEVYEENKKLRDQVKFLRVELMQSDRMSQAWLDTPEEFTNKEPISFEDLFDKISDFEFLEFTGDSSIAKELDVTELGARAGATWNALGGLNDYCRAKTANLVNGGIKEYIDNLPNGFMPLSSSIFRGKESNPVENNPKLSRQRYLNVPNSVDVSGKVFMFSHLTIGKRLHIHFYDDFSNSGKIYIGRIGPHLDTVSTN